MPSRGRGTVAQGTEEHAFGLLAQNADREDEAAEAAAAERSALERARRAQEQAERRNAIEAVMVTEAAEADEAEEALREALRLAQEHEDRKALRHLLADDELTLTRHALTANWERIEPLYRSWGAEQITPRLFLSGLHLLGIELDLDEISRLFGRIAPSRLVELRLLHVLCRRGGLGEREAGRGHEKGDGVEAGGGGAEGSSDSPSLLPPDEPRGPARPHYAGRQAVRRRPPPEMRPRPTRGSSVPAPQYRSPHQAPYQPPHQPPHQPPAAAQPPHRPLHRQQPQHRIAPASPMPRARRDPRLSVAWPPSYAPPAAEPPTAPHMRAWQEQQHRHFPHESTPAAAKAKVAATRPQSAAVARGGAGSGLVLAATGTAVQQRPTSAPTTRLPASIAGSSSSARAPPLLSAPMQAHLDLIVF